MVNGELHTWPVFRVLRSRSLLATPSTCLPARRQMVSWRHLAYGPSCNNPHAPCPYVAPSHSSSPLQALLFFYNSHFSYSLAPVLTPNSCSLPSIFPLLKEPEPSNLPVHLSLLFPSFPPTLSFLQQDNFSLLLVQPVTSNE